MTKLAATINEAVEISGLSRSAIYKAAKEKRLTIRKNKGRSLILISELQTFLQSLPAVEA
ncbi:helix-turn-helix domain-containing protein [Mesorhizobium marinum]|uniref:helix-turn-helix domain-containing protein n=1 Tax=Mesorhizobium marinum TaxID=3228790 RepID=UPI003464EB2D